MNPLISLIEDSVLGNFSTFSVSSFSSIFLGSPKEFIGLLSFSNLDLSRLFVGMQIQQMLL
ncbi:hypothetical protein [Mycoplasmopsis agalactiae]|uniref:hypothetical protein n=1 Tax=Mycoplasmopsis agalactiae TaxID=2110 RepID=UPI001F3A903F|nr:hypothetical protein [Mycoplasmopsis agalactiae]